MGLRVAKTRESHWSIFYVFYFWSFYVDFRLFCQCLLLFYEIFWQLCPLLEDYFLEFNMLFDQGFQLVNNLVILNDILITFLTIFAVFLGVSIIFLCVLGSFRVFSFSPFQRG